MDATALGVTMSDETKQEIFDESLQDFAHKVGIICALEQGGKIESKEAYKQIKDLFKELKATKKHLFPKPLDLKAIKNEPEN